MEVNNEEFYLLAVNGVSREEIITKCQSVYNNECECMFAEKFSEMMQMIELPIQDTVSLKLYSLPTHSVSTIATHPSTQENSEILRDNRTLTNEACYF